MIRRLVLILVIFAIAHRAAAQWGPDVRLTNDVSFSSTAFNNARSIAGGSGDLHVAWFDDRDGNDEIYYKRSLDGGLRWSSDARLTNNASVSKFPSVGLSGSTVHVVWEEYRDGNAEIYYKRSADAGLTWGPDIRLTSNAATSLAPSISASGEIVHVVWFDARNGNHEIFYKRSPDGGVTWGADTRLTFNSAPSLYAGAWASGEEVHVVWEEYRDGPSGEIYYKRSPDGGLTWGADTRLTNNPAKSLSPSVAVSASHVQVVWFDERDDNSEIYEKHSSDGGINWSADVRLTSNSANSQFPCVGSPGTELEFAL